METGHRHAFAPWVIASAMIITFTCPAAIAQPARRDSLVELRQDLEALRQALALVDGRRLGQEAALTELAARIAQLEQRAIALESYAAVDPTAQLTAIRDQLYAQIAQLQAQVQAVLESPAPTQVDHEGGFVWTSEDEAYQLRIGGHLQPRFTIARDVAGADTGFALRRARVVLDGTGAADLGFRVMAELVDEPALLDGWLEYRMGGLALRAGKDRIPFLRSGVMPEHQYAFAERSVVADAYGWGRDVGLQLRARPARIPMAAVLMVANGGPGARPDDVPVVALRVQATPMGPAPDPGQADLAHTRGVAVTLGMNVVIDGLAAPAAVGAIAVNNDLDGDGDPDRILSATTGVDLTIRSHGVELAGELMYRFDSWGELLAMNPDLKAAIGGGPADEPRRYLAGGIDLTYAVADELVIGGRIAGGALPFLATDGASALPRGETVLETGATAGFYDDGVRVLGVTYRHLNYGQGYAEGPDGPVEHLVMVEAQVVL